ncbi:Gfo/Idh/MocA family oxidoreductase [Gordonia sp. ABSL11-1]|uniref:Gfo/Idh/MocA family protein n=1 Tax=Gordonia sp. ABSL11-1 TaxID=3053924 RepID=UPI002572C5A8|nr:Gfo/Idh/MocA family oxidoreductase [Gordonia sp. ABSL11-1]MDL9944613.1 Gfo/Idh/MocA family oxidoreductase [Gordonia sp. ABSL11-1]
MISRLPAPRTQDPTTAPALRWGIMGPGWIAERFVSSLHKHTNQQVTAVGSRSAGRADDFARRMGVPTAHSGYDALLSDPAVEIVYVSTPHPQHHRCALDAIAAGKHVLIEKPMGVNARQAREIVAAAHHAGVFAGEAMWTRFLPKFDVILQIVDDGMLGTVRAVAADHGEYFTTDHRIYDPALAGGPLLDLGTYPVAFARWFLGDVSTVSAIGQPANHELNGQISAVLGHVGGGQSVLNTTILANTPTTAFVAGENGYLEVPGPFYQPGPFRVVPRDGEPLEHTEETAAHADGLHFSAVDAARRIADGAIDSDIHPSADVIATLDIMDRVRAQIGIDFAGD